jgi:ATP-dependent DNA helicase MPH1
MLGSFFAELSIDEAHKASGSYAYTTILAYITAHHPHFRVLALTATPGADVPRVQAVVDALHISRIEIREAEAPEISKYMNEKVSLSAQLGHRLN